MTVLEKSTNGIMEMIFGIPFMVPYIRQFSAIVPILHFFGATWDKVALYLMPI